jgi:nucleoside-diphosphate-sugar epimerase
VLNHFLITGASGFIGSRLCLHLASKGKKIRCVSRASDLPWETVCANLNGETDWSEALQGVECIVHLAARVHVMGVKSNDSLDEYRAVNVFGTTNLAKQAADAGVKRFVYVSTIKVNGEETKQGSVFTADDVPSPSDYYGITKWEAEKELIAMSKKTNMEVVIIRPPLVYGPGAKGNFATLLKWLSKGVPLPLDGIDNKRSFIALDNLISLITLCIEHPDAKNKTFLAADGEDLSTTLLLQKLGSAVGKTARLFYIQKGNLELMGKLFGKQKAVQKLVGSLQVDISKTRDILGWVPPLSVDEGLRRCVLNCDE